MDPIYMALGIQAVKLLQEAFKAGSEKIMDGGLERTGEAIFEFLQKKLTKPGQPEALAQFKEKPEEPLNAEMLKLQLQTALKNDPALIEELQKLLPPAQPGTSQSIGPVSGDNNKIGQAANGSSVQIS